MASALFHGLLLGALLVKLDDLRDLVAHPHNGVQGGHGILKDHGDLIAADLSQLAVLHLEQILPVEEDLSAADLGGGLGQKPQNGQGGGGLARAGLAHQTQGLALFDGEADAVDRLDHRVVGAVVNGQIFDLK